jgi:geranylgeranyl pyrophosphate synthase
MLGQVVESARGTKFVDPPAIFKSYERLAIGKSASLLSLALELPLLVAGLEDSLPLAQATAQSFAVAYQIADDLEDQVEDALQGSLNILSLLEHDGALSRTQAERAAATHALAVLATAISSGMQLPSGCAAVLISSAEGLQKRLVAMQGRLSAPLSLS